MSTQTACSMVNFASLTQFSSNAALSVLASSMAWLPEGELLTATRTQGQETPDGPVNDSSAAFRPLDFRARPNAAHAVGTEAGGASDAEAHTPFRLAPRSVAEESASLRLAYVPATQTAVYLSETQCCLLSPAFAARDCESADAMEAPHHPPVWNAGAM